MSGCACASAERGAFEIFATQHYVNGKACMRVYLACDEESANAAVARNTFAGVWSGHRMSWVKPSAAWMAYRCGWTIHKDRRQTNVLALDVDASKFEVLLSQAVVSHGEAAQQGTEYKTSPVVVQWDPERAIDPASVEKKDSPYLRRLTDIRSLQVGLRTTAWASFFTDPTYVVRTSDVTASFRAAHDALKAGSLDAATAALWPDPALRESRFAASAEVARTIQIG